MRDLKKDGIYYLVFSSEEERDQYVRAHRDGARRDHRSNLDKLRSAYIARLQEDPENGDKYSRAYMSDVKEEFDSFYKIVGMVSNNEKYLILEADLARSV